MLMSGIYITIPCVLRQYLASTQVFRCVWRQTARIGPLRIDLPTERGSDQALDVFRSRDRRLFQRLAVRHRHLRAAQATHRCVEVVERFLLNARGELGGDAVR